MCFEERLKNCFGSRDPLIWINFISSRSERERETEGERNAFSMAHTKNIGKKTISISDMYIATKYPQKGNARKNNNLLLH